MATALPVLPQDPDSAEWQQQATDTVAQGDALYQQGRYYEAADAYGEVANVDMWFLHAGPRQIMALVRAGLADTGATEALAAATSAFRTLEGFPLPEDLQNEYAAIEEALRQHDAGPAEATQAPIEPTAAAEALDTPTPEPPTEEEPTPLPTIADDDELVIEEQIVTTETLVPSEEEPSYATPEPTPALEAGEPAAGSESEEPVATEPTPELPEPTPTPVPPTPTATPTAIPPVRSRPVVQEGDIVSLANVTTPPRLTRSIPPEYPTQARRMRISGDAKVSILVGTDGSTERVQFLSVPRKGVGFEAAVETAVSRWHFVPATKDGVVVRTWVPVRIPFTLVQ